MPFARIAAEHDVHDVCRYFLAALQLLRFKPFDSEKLRGEGHTGGRSGNDKAHQEWEAVGPTTCHGRRGEPSIGVEAVAQDAGYCPHKKLNAILLCRVAIEARREQQLAAGRQIPRANPKEHAARNRKHRANVCEPSHMPPMKTRKNGIKSKSHRGAARKSQQEGEQSKSVGGFGLQK